MTQEEACFFGVVFDRRDRYLGKIQLKDYGDCVCFAYSVQQSVLDYRFLIESKDEEMMIEVEKNKKGIHVSYQHFLFDSLLENANEFDTTNKALYFNFDWMTEETAKETQKTLAIYDIYFGTQFIKHSLL